MTIEIKRDKLAKRRLSSQAIKDFQKNYFEEYNIKLSDDEAEHAALNLLHLAKLIYRPIPK